MNTSELLPDHVTMVTQAPPSVVGIANRLFIDYYMQRISVNLTNDCNGNRLNYNNDLPAIGNKNYALQKPFVTDFLTTATQNSDRHSSFVE